MRRGEVMRILIVQFVPFGRSPPLPRFDHELGVAAAMLRQEGFELALLPADGYRPEALHQAINLHRPDQVLVDIPPTSITAAHRTIVDVAEKHFLPVTVVGVRATCRPREAISIPGVAALVVGEYDRAVVELLRCLRDGADPAGTGEKPAVAGVWVNSEDGLVRGEPAPLADDLDALPPSDRELFDTAGTVAASGEIDFQATRGCPWWCAFCLNDWYMDLYAAAGPLHRRRSIGGLLDEVSAVVRRYDRARRVRFVDHPFAADIDWLADFAHDYPRRCALPYRCHVPLSALDQRVPAMLARSGCETVSVEVGSGSRFIREEVLGLRMTRQQIVRGVAALKAEGLRVEGSVFVGAPYESEVSIDETIDLLARLDLDALRARVYYPVPGTRSAEICAENGWISGRGEENFHANRSVLDMPSLAPGQIDDIAARLETLVRRRRTGSVWSWLRRMRKLAAKPLRLRRAKRPPGGSTRRR